ncbi:PilX N-terminal domain-containing pilus assembly protein [Pseudomonas sp. LFM046]|uniref:PilX N-terminal domain-containing pilus assembly protein n=1 Tax=Pseudomonas sp. LFM046 TaxID=1608357 RepID=UPI000A5151CD|nr:PilX N-terminal domain-containing pilus assembly protein [Pseudomonas sp. LFM046]
MSKVQFKNREQGAALVVGLIMLLLLTMLVSSAFTMSSVNLKSVGNMQTRDEALAAANTAIELVVSTDFTAAPKETRSNVDIDNDGNVDYVVDIATPVCIQESLAQVVAPSSENLSMSSNTWNTVWSVNATVSDSKTGGSVQVRSGVRVLLTDAKKNAVCP